MTHPVSHLRGSGLQQLRAHVLPVLRVLNLVIKQQLAVLAHARLQNEN